MDIESLVTRLKWLPLCVSGPSELVTSLAPSIVPLVALFAWSHNAYERSLCETGDRRSFTGYLRFLLAPRHTEGISFSPWSSVTRPPREVSEMEEKV